MANRALPVQSIPVNLGGVGVVVLVPGLAEYEIIVVSLALSANGAQQLVLQDLTGALGDLWMVNGVPHVWPEHNAGWVRTRDGEPLTAAQTLAGAVAGTLSYQYVPSHQER